MPATQVAVDWTARAQIVKKLFPIYLLFCERFGMPEAPVTNLRSLKANIDPSLVERVELWMNELDRCIDAFQMRSVVQGSNVGASELRILALLERLLAKPNADAADLSKIEFLLAQFLATHLSLNPEQTPTLAEVAEALEPVIGKVSTVEQVPGLESLTWELLSTQRLAEVKRTSIIERGREAKKALGSQAVLPGNLVACSRFNFLLRKRCFELMKEEGKRIGSGLQTLTDRGVKTLDCEAAQLSAAETISNLMNLCKGWQDGKPDDYAYDNPFSQVLALQEIVEKAVADIESEPVSSHNVPQHVEEHQKPSPEVIQVYAELSALQREHQYLTEQAQQQKENAANLERQVADLQTQLSASEVRFQAIKIEQAASEDANAKLQAKLAEAEDANSKLRAKLAELDQKLATPPVPAPAAIPQEGPVPKPSTADTSPKPVDTPTTAAPAPAKEAPKAASIQEIVQTLARRMEQIREALALPETKARKEAPSHLKINHVSIMLTASETQAFIAPSSAADDLICRGVAARFLLLELAKNTERESSGASEAIVNVCEAGAAQLQEQAGRLSPEQAERVTETASLLMKTLKGFHRK